MKTEIVCEQSQQDDDFSCDFEAAFDLNHAEFLKETVKEKDNDSDEQCHICHRDQLIKGTRWHYDESLEEIDMCADCAKAQHVVEHPLHTSPHTFLVIKPQIFRNYDTDYLPNNFNNTSCNYFNPNFLPE